MDAVRNAPYLALLGSLVITSAALGIAACGGGDSTGAVDGTSSAPTASSEGASSDGGASSSGGATDGGSPSGSGGATDGGSPSSSGGATDGGSPSSSGGATDGGASAGATSTGGGTGAGGSGGGTSGPRITRLVIAGDTGEGNLNQREVAKQMSTRCEEAGGCQAALLAGDNFYDDGVTSTADPLWVTTFEHPYDQPFLNDLKFYAVIGNHDAGPSSSGSANAQVDYTTLPVGPGTQTNGSYPDLMFPEAGQRLSDKWMMPSKYYDVRIGDVHLFAIDTNSSISWGYLDDQRQAVKAAMTASDATWKIVMGHVPRFTSGEHRLDNPLVNALTGGRLFDLIEETACLGDAYIAGHDHDLELIDRGQFDCPQAFEVISGAGSKTRDGGNTRTDGSAFYNDTDPGFVYMEFVGNDTVNVEFIDMHGNLLFSKSYDKL